MIKATRSERIAEPPISASPRRVRKVFEKAGIELSEQWDVDEIAAGFKFSILERREREIEVPNPVDPEKPAWSLVEARVVIGSVIVSELPGSVYGDDPDVMWLHASMAYVLGRNTPTYEEMATLKSATFGPNRYAYMVFASESDHVNHHVNALHLFGRRDGARVLPDFRVLGSI